MRCAAIARRTGKQCGRSALPGGRYCRYHRGDGEARRRDGETRRRGVDMPEASSTGEMGREHSFYSDALDEEGLGLEVASALRGVDDEIAVLRMLIRKAVREGDADATRKGIETLCRAIKVQYALDGRSAEGLAGSLARVLDEVGNELGMSL